MGGSHSREGNLDSSDEEEEEEEEVEEEEEERGSHVLIHDTVKRFESVAETGMKESLDNLSLNEKADSKAVMKEQENVNPQSMKNKVKLYHHLGGNTPKARWVVADKLVNFVFMKEGEEEEDEDDEDEDERKSKAKPEFRKWILRVGNRVRARVDDRLQMKFFDDALRVDFVFQGVWAMKFLNQPEYFAFIAEFQNYMFENTYQLKATQENKMKVFGKEFMGWAKPEEADESIWDEYPSKDETLTKAKDLKETMAEASTGGIRSLTMGALDYSFLVSDAGIETFKNGYGGVKSRGISVQLGQGKSEPCTPQKGMLIRGESNMLLLSPAMDKSVHHSSGVHQLDLESGKVVAEWKFGKDGTPITMRDVTNDSKGAQLDPSLSTFLGLDDNRLCRWDMRVAQGIVQEIDSPHLSWAEGHQFSRGTNFQCFASSGDGCVVVGSRDGKIRLYGTTSMRQAKTSFPGLGSPITHVDVTFDGKWVLATTDAYLILISTMFKDKDGKTKTGFHGRMGNRIAAPRLLKLTPVDSHLAGKNHKFRGGQFSWVTEAGKEEHNMVVTVGNFTVLWNFNRVKQSDHECYKNATGLKSCYCYKIIPKEESIVASKFMHDNFNQLRSPEAPVVVATPRKTSLE